MPSGRCWAKEDCRLIPPFGCDPGGAGEVDVARDDEGDGERCRGLGLISGSNSESLSEGCSCRSFWLSLIVALSKLGRLVIRASVELSSPTSGIGLKNNGPLLSP